MAPGIVRDVGDVADLAALIAPRRVVIAGGVGGDGKPLGPSNSGRPTGGLGSPGRRWRPGVESPC